MLSVLVHGSTRSTAAAHPIFPTPRNHAVSPKPLLLSSAQPKPSSSVSLSFSLPHNRPTRLRRPASPAVAADALATSDDVAEEDGEQSNETETKRLGVVVKAMEKPRLVLKFVWMEKNIGLALDRAVPGHGTVPLSPYYFWPRKDAWEELKSLLESKPWISQKRMIILLNQATDIINLWQQSGGSL